MRLWSSNVEGWSQLEAKDPARQRILNADGSETVSVKFGDTFSSYSDDRTLEDGPSFHEGDEIWISWSTLYPPGTVLAYPKEDELSGWPSISHTFGSCVEWHHEPSANGKYKGNWNLMPQGSAPIYTGVGPSGQYLNLVKSIDISESYKLFTVPLIIGKLNQHLMHVIWSADPAKGLIEYWINGDSVGGPLQVFTLFPDCDTYLVAGIYRRGTIGDPSLIWPVDGKPGPDYGAFFPHKGARVYVRDDGYPASMTFGPVVIGTTRADVTTAGGTVTPPAPPAPVAPAIDVNKAKEGLALLIADKAKWDAQVTQLSSLVTQLVSLGPLLPPLIGPLVAARDAAKAQSAAIEQLLNKGPW